MTRFFLLLVLLAAAPASAQDTSVDRDTEIASLRTRLDALKDSINDAPPRSTNRKRFLAEQGRVERLLATAQNQLADTARDTAETAGPATAASPGRPERPSTGDVLPTDEQHASSPILSPLVLGMFAVLGTILAGVGLWVMGQRKRQGVVSPMVARRPPLTGAEQQQRHAAQGGLPLYASHGAVETLERQVQALRRELDEARAWITEQHRSQQAAAAAPAPAPAVAAPQPAATPADAVAAAFTDWCRRATPMMGKVDFFGNALAASVPGARVQTVFRDLNSQAEPIRFDARGGASPAEFWLVTAGGDALLFPQPLTATQFRDLTRVFEGSATPQALGQITPARVRDEGGSFVLAQPGRVS